MFLLGLFIESTILHVGPTSAHYVTYVRMRNVKSRWSEWIIFASRVEKGNLLISWTSTVRQTTIPKPASIGDLEENICNEIVALDPEIF